jgi:hypothetical protein
MSTSNLYICTSIHIRMTITIFSLPTTLFYHYFPFPFFFKYLIRCCYNIKHDNKIIHLLYQKFNWFQIKLIDIIILYMFICYSATTITIYNIIILLLREYLFIFLIFLYFFVKINFFCSVKFNLTIFIIDCFYMTMVWSYTRRSL